MKIGAECRRSGKTAFAVWAPLVRKVALKIAERGVVIMEKDESGYWRTEVEGAGGGTRYGYILNDALGRPDPASHFQPEGVHALSEVVDHASFRWDDVNWAGIPLNEMIMYELHVGAFSRDGTFEAIMGRIEHFKELGVNAVEIMPVAQFPGERNWGYDGAYPFAVQNSYGGPRGLKALINALHGQGIAVILDVVYNHCGPEGCYISDFGPYFTHKYATPWGDAINYDDADSDGVRNFYIRNAIHWFEHYHADALRLDAIEHIHDASPVHILRQMKDEVEAFSGRRGRECYLVAESDLNEIKVITPAEAGGYGMDAQWCDDFHHSLQALLTGEKARYYIDFGQTRHLEKSMREGFVYGNEYSLFRKKPHGNSSKGVPAERFIVFAQNHDQVGNRWRGERLSSLVDFERLKLAAGTVMASPYIPLLFMGEEYGEDAPFLYFIDHSDKNLIAVVAEERKKQFQADDPASSGPPPDPQDAAAFLESKLRWDKLARKRHLALFNYYRRLIALRKEIPALRTGGKSGLEVACSEDAMLLCIRRRHAQSEILCILSFDKNICSGSVSFPPGRWKKLIDSSEPQWMGAGSGMPATAAGDMALRIMPHSFTMYEGAP